MGKFDRKFIFDIENNIINEIYEDSSDMLYKIGEYMDENEIIAMPKDSFIGLFDEYDKKIKENVLFSIKDHIKIFMKEEYDRGYKDAENKFNKKS